MKSWSDSLNTKYSFNRRLPTPSPSLRFARSIQLSARRRLPKAGSPSSIIRLFLCSRTLSWIKRQFAGSKHGFQTIKYGICDGWMAAQSKYTELISPAVGGTVLLMLHTYSTTVQYILRARKLREHQQRKMASFFPLSVFVIFHHVNCNTKPSWIYYICQCSHLSSNHISQWR